MRDLRFHIVLSLVGVLLDGYALGGSPSSCLLQQQSFGKRATKRLDEEPKRIYSKRAPLSVTKQPTMASDVALLRLGPPPGSQSAGGKTQPVAAGKVPNTGRGPKSGAKTAPVQPGKVATTTAEPMLEYGDDETMSKRVEMNIDMPLKEINSGSNGPLPKFSSTFKAEILAAMNLDPERVAIMGFRGGYLKSSAGGASLAQHDNGASEGTQIDFEVTAGKPSAGRSLGSLTAQMADKRSKLMTGTMKGAFSGAVLVVSEGSKSTHPANSWREKQAPPVSEESQGFPAPVMTALFVVLFAMMAVACIYFMRSRLK